MRCKGRVESPQKKMTSLRQLIRENYERLSSEFMRTRKWARTQVRVLGKSYFVTWEGGYVQP